MPKTALRLFAIFAALTACTNGVTPDCSGDAGPCGYQLPASADASGDAGAD